ncbi:chemotaxis protein CheB [Nocardioides sp. URHA0032]|uniref:chemotaxis protein CheB n=1 Tax=Nocardioides sp. URHA0032 TaxID=1380388 RepID=UPI0018CC3583|nr:chemotaxis protein CheB [Nocardioides sp. URHA0032]
MTTPGMPSPPALVVVGASAGGVEALRDLVATLPSDLPACVLIVLHMPPDAASALPSILRRVAPLRVRQASDGDRVRAGEVLVAPPDHHVVVIDGTVALTRGPTESGHRPAIDVLFRSAARAAGPRVVGVVLSGALDDGAAGALAVASRGGRVVVQDFDEALYDSMPRSAARAVPDAVRSPVAAMAGLLVRWCEELPAEPAGEGVLVALEMEVEMAELDPDALHDAERPGTPSGFGCPDCAGALFEISEGVLHRYRCRVGHAWSPESLAARQTVAMESALWMALRSLEEKAVLNTDLAERARRDSRVRTAARFAESADDARRAAELVRQLIADVGRAIEEEREA